MGEADGAKDRILQKKIARLEEELASASSENDALRKRLSAKRYRLMDKLADSVYGVPKMLGLKKDSDPVVELEKAKHLRKLVPKQVQVVERKVDIININFYDQKGGVVYKGGAERYVYDLACLLKELHYHVRILQCSDIPFEKEYRGIKVIGIGNGAIKDVWAISSLYNDFCADCEFVIASPLILAARIVDVPVIGINHGVDFDTEWNIYRRGQPMPSREEYLEALKNVDVCVCVDTNFINWTRTVDYNLSLKEKFVPNYYNKKQFGSIRKKEQQPNEKIVFAFPRRINAARGHDLVIAAVRKVVEEYKDRVVLNFVGQIDSETAGEELAEFMKEFPSNVFYYSYEMEDMAEAYERADVILIPSKYCEGTSLSCIEAMAFEKPIIATNVGGLSNLIIDHFNGLLIPPTAEDLERAVLDMIENGDLRIKLAKNAKMVANSTLEKKNWESRWEQIIASMKD